ncbi:hypothetical protein JCM10512_4461 [Bacteroides reticulotermitis JCM 10512]|uniref:Uncharacterized protein n=2 Tax=Bacteroides reticulotermitis TaxID=1133319 RepID=W4UYI5_9BACE|nr:hypothetical protein JCM10512_4461 [Bacteroides reticulotermitis JCM 10512]
MVNYINIDDAYINLIRVSAGLLCGTYALYKSSSHIRSVVIKLALFFSMLLIASLISNSNAHFVNILWVWSYIGIALLIYNHSISVDIAKLILIAYTIVFLVGSVFNKVEASELFTTGSANGVSVLFIYAISLYYIIKYQNFKNSNMPYLPILLLAFFSIWAANRSGLLTAVILAFGAFLNNIVFNKSGYNKGKSIIALLLVCVLIFFITDNYLGSYSENMLNKYDRYGNESVRILIWYEYFNACLNNIEYFLFGAPASDTKIIHYHFYNGNTHNAFFMLHAKFGIIGLIFFVYNIFKFILRQIGKGKIYLIVVAAGIITRGMFDWTSFPGLHDIFFWLIIMYNYLGDDAKYKIA